MESTCTNRSREKKNGDNCKLKETGKNKKEWKSKNNFYSKPCKRPKNQNKKRQRKKQ